MAVHKIKKGLDLPITGAPAQKISDGPKVTRVAVMNDDYPFMKPRMLVKVGDQVKRGQPLFEDRKTEGVVFTAPGGGEVVAVNRGERRKLESVVIALSGDEGEVQYTHYSGSPVGDVSGEQARALLVESGLWTALRQRPFSKVPSPSESCHSIFVTAMASDPLAPDMDVVMAGRQEQITAGLTVLSKLTEGPVWLCRKPGSKIDAGGAPRVSVEEFTGPHPAGLPGTHIHTLAPASRTRTAWYLNIQDVAAIGALFTTGKLDVERVVSLAGPVVKEPKLLRTRLGASTAELTAGALQGGENRIVSGSVLSGHKAQGDVFGYIGRYHQTVSCLAEDRERVFLGWLGPGMDKFSTARAFLSGIFGMGKKFNFTTTTHGSHRAMVPIGMFERVMPLDVMPTFLLRALIAGDLEQSEKLGCLELDEEDLGLCSFVSPGKEDYGVILRKRLTTIWKEG
ncbi:MAG: NADH:ubiquinone reductase (Na(+)-transporting) subunit A [Myxococcales bacterium]|nr:NADH:ubiquinone reductase (Na(+)-transporting) subunit A [Myxococcales bacterium]